MAFVIYSKRNVKAGTFLEKLRAEKSPNFDSEYSEKSEGEYSIMEDKVFDDLSEHQRQKYSTVINRYPALNIWDKTWILISELNKWVLISHLDSKNPELSYNPYFVKVDEYHLLDVENEILYKRVD